MPSIKPSGIPTFWPLFAPGFLERARSPDEDKKTGNPGVRLETHMEAFHLPAVW
jgi:hypothetical protein